MYKDDVQPLDLRFVGGPLDGKVQDYTGDREMSPLWLDEGGQPEWDGVSPHYWLQRRERSTILALWEARHGAM